MKIPAALYGDEASVQQFARRFVKRLYQGGDPQQLFSELSYVEWEDHPAEILIANGTNPDNRVLEPDRQVWRTHAIGEAFKSQIWELMCACPTFEDRIERTDNILLEGLESLWFVVATFNHDWDDHRFFSCRNNLLNDVIDEVYFRAYLPHIRPVQEYVPHFVDWGALGRYGEDAPHWWAKPILVVVYSTGRCELFGVDMIAHDGDLCAALEAVGVYVP